MPRCRIDVDASPTFARLVKRLHKKYQRLREDLEEAFTSIEKDYTSAAHSNAIPGFNRRVWKYRWKSSDLQKGAQKGIRIIAYYDPDTETLYPILLYLKAEREDISEEEMKEAIADLKGSIEGSQDTSQN